MQLPFGLGAYSRLNDRLPPVRLVNMFAEQAPTSKTGFALIPRPGLGVEREVSGAVRGLYRQPGISLGSLYTLAGTNIYRDGTLLTGSVAGTDFAEWVVTVDGFRVLSGGDIYRITETAATVQAFPDSADVASLAAINDIMVAVRKDTGNIYFWLPGDTDWGALDFFGADREPDAVIAVRTLNDELWAFGASSVEVFYPTGDATVPFRRAEGRGIERGCFSRDSIVKMDNALFWVTEGRQVVRDGQRVSNHGIEEQIGRSTTAVAWTYELDGHTFYVLNLDDQTITYDAATGEWHQLKLYDQDGFSRIGICDQGETFLGGVDVVWTFEDRSDDDGEPLERIFTSIIATDAPLSCDALEIECNTGSSPLPTDCVLQTSWSSDQGRTWTDPRDVMIGREGEYRTRARMRRLGMVDAPGRINEHRITDPAYIRVSGVIMNPPGGGRSR